MKVELKPGRYILAVSGGVDSMVLLDLLSREAALELIVAHFNHGIRAESNIDAELVQQASFRKSLIFELGKGKLGATASEDQARTARYKFLNRLKDKYEARAIITAHHQDDLIETAFINVIRGTGPRGLVAMLDNPSVLRPLAEVSKKDILKYAKVNQVKWIEDSTNSDDKYLRNYLRVNVTPKMTSSDRQTVLASIAKVNNSLHESQSVIATISQKIINQYNQINRQEFTALPSEVGRELLLAWLNRRGISDVDRKMVDRLDVAIRTSKAGTKHEINRGFTLDLTNQTAQISNTL